MRTPDSVKRGLRHLKPSRKFWLLMIWMVPVLYSTLGFYSNEQTRQNQHDSDARTVAALARQTQARRDVRQEELETLCMAVEHLRDAVVVGQTNSTQNPLPVPPNIDPALKQVIEFVNARAGSGSAAILAEVDKARCPPALRRK